MRKKRLFLGLLILFVLVLVSCVDTNIEEPVKLDSPVISKDDDNTIKWNEVDNATDYLLEINKDAPLVVTSTTYKVTEYGEYEFRVKARTGDETKYLDSDWSSLFTLNYKEPEEELTKMQAPLIDKANYHSVHWLPVDDASGYLVYLNDEEAEELLGDVTTYSILDKPYGIYKIEIVTVPTNKLLYENSNKSNAVTLETIDPLDYNDRLVLTIIGKDEVIKDDDFLYEVVITEKDGVDVSFLDLDVTFEVIKGNTLVTISDLGLLEALDLGDVTIKATLDDYDQVSSTFDLEVINRPTLLITMDNYEMGSEDNKALIDTNQDGILYYLNLDEEPLSIEDFLVLNPKGVPITKTTDEILVVLDNVDKSKLDVYFVFEYIKDGVSIGYSNLISLIDIELIVLPVEVSTQGELRDALLNNENHIILKNDIEMIGVWEQVATVFTGILDGNGYTISNLSVEGSNTGLLRTLGNGATFKNITFDNAKASNFTNANDGIIASTMVAGSKVLFENFVLINSQSISSVDGSARSTHGALIARIDNAGDVDARITLDNVYIDYTHNITRSTDTANVGGLFGTFKLGGEDALVMNNVYLDIKVISTNAKINNAGAIFGQGQGKFNLENTLIKFHFESPSGGLYGLVGGYYSNEANTDFTTNNVILLSVPSVSLKGNWNDGTYIRTTMLVNIDEEDLEDFDDNINSNWVYHDNTLSLKVNEVDYLVDAGERLDAPVITLDGFIINWSEVLNASSYQVYVNGESIDSETNDLSFNVSSLGSGNYIVKVVALGDNVNYANSNFSNEVTVLVEIAEQLDEPVITNDELIVSWAEVSNATEYEVYVNDILVDTVEELSFDLNDLELEGLVYVRVKALGDSLNYLDSKLSNELAIIVSLELVANGEELRSALDNNKQYIKLANDITLTGVWDQVKTVFTGVLDGNGYKVLDLRVEGSNTGLLRTLGNGATFINITFENATAGNFSNANDGVIASTIADGAKVLFENFVLVGGESISSVDGSARSTHGALIAKIDNAGDVDARITLDNVYIDYTHNITRSTDTSNVGGLFGTFKLGGEDALIMNNVILNINIINTGPNKITNAGAIFGQGQAKMTFDNVLINYNYESASSSNVGIDLGYVSSQTNTVLNISNVIILAKSTLNLKGDWDESEYIKASMINYLDSSLLLDFAGASNSNFKYLDDVLSLTILDVDYAVLKGDALDSPVLVKDGFKVTWEEVDNALNYEVYANDILVDTTDLLYYEFDVEENEGLVVVKVVAIGDPDLYYMSNPSNEIDLIFDIEIVTNGEELHAALNVNAPYIKLANDITLTGVWTQVMIVFTGVLDGDNHKIINLRVEGSNTGLLRTLGDGATFKNITFENATAGEFSNANDGIIASTMTEGAKVLFENFALVGGESTSSVDGGSRSTHGALIARIDNASDTNAKVTLRNVYFEYTHTVTRNTDTGNIGGLFGTFKLGGDEALLMENVFLDISVINTGDNKTNNVGAIFGQGQAKMTLNEVLIKLTYESTGSNGGVDVGYVSSQTNTVINARGVILIDLNNKTVKANNWTEDSYTLFNPGNPIDGSLLEVLEKPDGWVFSDDNASLTVAGNEYFAIKIE